jgi:hypothetical protein
VGGVEGRLGLCGAATPAEIPVARQGGEPLSGELGGLGWG